jgi:hypothetical protein
MFLDHTPPVEFLWTSDKFVAETALHDTQQTQEKNIHALSATLARDPSNQTVSDVVLDGTTTGIGLCCNSLCKSRDS